MCGFEYTCLSTHEIDCHYDFSICDSTFIYVDTDMRSTDVLTGDVQLSLALVAFVKILMKMDTI